MNIPFVFISAFATDKNYKITNELMPFGIVKKPFSNQKIIQIVNNFVMIQRL
jgi:hypothetical protein